MVVNAASTILSQGGLQSATTQGGLHSATKQKLFDHLLSTSEELDLTTSLHRKSVDQQPV